MCGTRKTKYLSGAEIYADGYIRAKHRYIEALFLDARFPRKSVTLALLDRLQPRRRLGMSQPQISLTHARGLYSGYINIVLQWLRQITIFTNVIIFVPFKHATCLV